MNITKLTIREMEETVKGMKKAYWTVRILQFVAICGALFGFVGILGSAGALEWENITVGRFVVQSLISIAVLFVAGSFLDKTENIPEKLKRNICKLNRRIRQEKYRAKMRKQCDNQIIVPTEQPISNVS